MKAKCYYKLNYYFLTIWDRLRIPPFLNKTSCSYYYSDQHDRLDADEDAKNSIL